jgi:hypothetical protein
LLIYEGHVLRCYLVLIILLSFSFFNAQKTKGKTKRTEKRFALSAARLLLGHGKANYGSYRQMVSAVIGLGRPHSSLNAEAS